MLRFKDLMERVNDTRSLYLEQDKKLIKAKDNGSYPAHHDHITHDTYGDAGDEATSAHHKFASERAPVHTFKHLGSTHKIYHHPNGSTIHTMHHTHGHHGDDIAVYSGHHDPKHIENQEKKHSNMNESLDESRMKDLAMDMESLSHADFKKKHRRSKQEMQSSLKSEELKGSQHKIDANKNGKVDGHDFKILRNAKKARYQ